MNPKPGWKTTEFWLTAAANLLTLLYLTGVLIETSPIGQAVAMASAALTNAGYAVSRGKAKAAT